MYGPGVEFEIAPSRSGVVTFETGAVESEEYVRLFLHVFCLEEDGKLAIFVGDRVGCVRQEVGVGGSGEDDRRLRFLSMMTSNDGSGVDSDIHSDNASKQIRILLHREQQG